MKKDTQKVKKMTYQQIFSNESMSLAEMKERCKDITNLTKDDSIDLINLESFVKYLVKLHKPQAFEKLDSCVDCEEHSSTRNNFSVKKRKRPSLKIYKTSPEIEELTEQIRKAEMKIQKDKERVTLLRNFLGVEEESQGHIWISA